MAYAVGLIATDGCLLSKRKQIAFVSKDRDLIDTLLTCLGRASKYRSTRTRIGNEVFRAQFGDAGLYLWLLSIGLTPRKSLTLGSIEVPNEFLVDLVRGLLDGDGSIYTGVHAPTPSTYPNYRYERLWVFFASASILHIDWLRARLRKHLGIEGYVEEQHRAGRHPFYRLKYGKIASIKLLGELYRDPASPRLVRKWLKWEGFRERNLGRQASVPTEGVEPSWAYAHTALNRAPVPVRIRRRERQL